MKSFNTTGACFPAVHYMVNINHKLAEIKKLIDNGSYFVINRPRQYGKTTTLGLLSDYLDRFHLKKGYLLTFNFNKTKEVGIKNIFFKDKVLLEGMV